MAGNVTNTKSELMAAIRGLSAARDLPADVILDALKVALVSAYRKMPDGLASHVNVEINESTGETRVYAHYTVVDEAYLEDEHGEMTVAQAQAYRPGATIGDTVTFDVTPDDFGRIAAQTAKQVILQKIREAEREQTYSTYADRESEIVYGTVQTVNRDIVTVALDRVEAVLPKSGQIPGERYVPNQRLRVYVSEVKRSPKGPQVIVSRTHRDMLKRLMELEIPEVFQGIVEIKAIAREAGSRSKVAVWAHQEGVDPVGACVGMRGVRIQALVRELGGEKIDIVEWDPDPRRFIAHALSPARVMHVGLEDQAERRTASVIVPDSQLSLAIGREGQNARLAAKLTGWRIDIRAESEAGAVLEQLRAEEELRAAERALQASAAAEAHAAATAALAGAEVELEEELETEQPPAVTVTETELAPAAVAATEVEAAEPVVSQPLEALPEATGEPIPALAPAPADAAVEGPEVGVPAAAWDRAEVFEDEEGSEEQLVGRGKRKRKAKRLVRDPRTGQLVAERDRKGSRRRPEWEEDIGRWSDEDLDDALGFTEEDFLPSEPEEEEPRQEEPG